jgi:hypothetical protein
MPFQKLCFNLEQAHRSRPVYRLRSKVKQAQLPVTAVYGTMKAMKTNVPIRREYIGKKCRPMQPYWPLTAGARETPVYRMCIHLEQTHRSRPVYRLRSKVKQAQALSQPIWPVYRMCFQLLLLLRFLQLLLHQAHGLWLKPRRREYNEKLMRMLWLPELLRHIVAPLYRVILLSSTHEARQG